MRRCFGYLRKQFAIAAVFLFCGASRGQSLVQHGDTWRYRKGTSAPQTNWKTAADTALDASWLTGKGGFGYADNSAELSLCQTLLNDMHGNYSTLEMRKGFEITSAPDSAQHLVLTMDWDDGFIAWLDGNFLASANSPGSPSEPSFSASATSSHESSRGDNSAEPAVQYDLGLVGSRLAPGTHVLAIIGLNSSKNGSSDFVQVADLALKTVATNCVSGAITADTRLEGTNSVCGSVTIQPGATLTIAPGSRIELDQSVSITVADGGRLIVEGMETNRILFTKTAAATAWGGIVVEGSVGSPETRIAYADFQENGSTAVHSIAGTVFLDHLTFLTTEHQYVSLDGSSFIVSNCYFPAGTARFEPGHGTGGIKSGGHGIFTRNFFGGTLGYNDIVDFTGGNRPAPLVHFINNVFSGGQDDGLDLDGTDAWVEGNIFLHIHRNGDTPDSSAAVSGGDNSGNVSEVTITGNIFFDCDNAVTAKQGNFFTLLDNTIIHMTKTGGIDAASGAVNVRDTTPSLTAFARGLYLENNVITDVEQLVRNYDGSQTSVTINSNLLPVAWSGPGTGNVIASPEFTHPPTIPETHFTNWVEAQVLWDWVKLLSGSPGSGAGWKGNDQGAYNTPGAHLGSQIIRTNETSAHVDVGYVRSGNAIPVSGWPQGAGYTHYKWRLDDNDWSESVPIDIPIDISGLPSGPHYIEVSGQRDSGLFQNDSFFGLAATTTRTPTWIVNGTITFSNISRADGKTLLTFLIPGSGKYSVEFKDALENTVWTNLQDVTATSNGSLSVTDQTSVAKRFYRISSQQ